MKFLTSAHNRFMKKISWECYMFMCLLTPASLPNRSAGDFVPGWLQCKDMDRVCRKISLAIMLKL